MPTYPRQSPHASAAGAHAIEAVRLIQIGAGRERVQAELDLLANQLRSLSLIEHAWGCLSQNTTESVLHEITPSPAGLH